MMQFLSKSENTEESRLDQQKYVQVHIGATLKILALYLVAFSLLWIGCAKFIVPIYGYSRFTWAPNKIKIFESLMALVFFALSLPSKVKKPSDFFIHVHFLLPVVPMLVLYSASDLPRAYIYFVLLAFSIVCLFRKIKLPKIKGDMIPVQIMMWGLLIIAAILIFSIILQGGLRYINFNLLKVYEFRSLAALNLPKIYGYFSPMNSKVLLPFVLLLAVYRRKWLIAGLAISGCVMMFALTNHKGPLFYPFFILGIYFVMRSRRSSIQLMLLCCILTIFVSLVGFYAGGHGRTLGSLFLRRAYFVPAHLNFIYYDFFSTHPHTMLSDSKLTFGLIQYPYALDSAHVIGYHYFKSETCGANTGWLGTGYMHFNFAGMLIYALIVGLLLAMVDTLAKNRGFSLSGAILFIPLFAIFQSSDLPTGLLTHGFLLALFLTWSCRLKGQIGSRRRRIIASVCKLGRPS